MGGNKFEWIKNRVGSIFNKFFEDATYRTN